MGLVPSAPHRLLIDGSAFRSKRKVLGGSLLVDCSGSMSLHQSEIDELLKAAPHAVIGLYEGATNMGVLRVVSRRGKRAAKELCRHPLGTGNNVIDGVALRWLATQPAPRVWVSDGQVTGRAEGTTRSLLDDAAKVMKRGHIKRIPHVAEALEYFKYLRRNPQKARKLVAKAKVSFGRNRGGYVAVE